MSISLRRASLLLAFLILTSACAILEDLPRLKPSDLKFEPIQSSRIYAADNSVITTLHGEQNRTVVTLRKVPKRVQHAVIAIEDERFYEHDGVDWAAVLRAALANVRSGEIEQGGSTITQQLVKNVIIAPLGGAEKTLERKLKEASLARQLEQRMTKKEILEQYLNTVYFGEGAYGIEEAAQTYFAVPAKKLSLAQGAMLAALIRAPAQYDPFRNRQLAIQRRNLVLSKMEELGWATPEDAAAAQAEKLKLQTTEDKDRYAAPYFVDYVQRLITFDPRFKVIGSNVQRRTRRLFQGGLRIYTTVDLEDQAAAETAVDRVLPNRTDPHGSLVAIDPDNGHIRAMVGGRDWFAPKKKDRFAKVNLAIVAEPNVGREQCPRTLDKICAAGTGRQAGSAFKPFALAAAIEQGIPLSKLYKGDGPLVLPNADNGGPYTVNNYEGSAPGRITLLEATVRSVNVVYAQVVDEVGPEAVVETARGMGISTHLDPVFSVGLGSNEVNPLGMASAYSTLAAGGEHHPPVAITKIVDANGDVLYEDESVSEEVLEPAVSYLVTSALEQVIIRGTAANYGQVGRPSAGKTGTAQEYRDAWFVGYTPELVAAAWIGYPEGQVEMKPYCSTTDRSECRVTRTLSSGGVTGGSFPTQIWTAFMTRALSDETASSFPSVPGLVTITIDIRNGCLPSKFTPDEFIGEGTFAKGTEPKESCRVPGDSKKVPDVISFPVGDATRILKNAGFKVQEVSEVTDDLPPGRVVSTSPGAGERAAKGSVVTIYVSARTETVTVPDVLGMKEGDARYVLEDAGFKVVVIEEAESDEKEAKKRKGRVWKQSPGGGTEAEKGSEVVIWVNPE